jgi:hypothetical protein
MDQLVEKMEKKMAHNRDMDSTSVCQYGPIRRGNITGKWPTIE